MAGSDRPELVEWAAARLLAAGVHPEEYPVYNAYRFALVGEDPGLSEAERRSYVEPDPQLRSSLLVLERHDFPSVFQSAEQLVAKVDGAAAALNIDPQRRAEIATAATDQLVGAERAARELEIYQGASWVRKHLWPRLQLYRRPNRYGGWSYFVRRSQLDHVVRELRVGEAPDEELQPARQAWSSLNPRQQDYMAVVYRHQIDAPRTWLRYGCDDSGLPSPLWHAIERERSRDPGTGSSWNALERRELVECRYVHVNVLGVLEPQLEVRLTQLGHRVGQLGQEDAGLQLRRRQHDLANTLEAIAKDTHLNLARVKNALEGQGPEVLTAPAERALTRIEPRLAEAEKDLAAILKALANLRRESPSRRSHERSRRRKSDGKSDSNRPPRS
jgi:hypothetical protein